LKGELEALSYYDSSEPEETYSQEEQAGWFRYWHRIIIFTPTLFKPVKACMTQVRRVEIIQEGNLI